MTLSRPVLASIVAAVLSATLVVATILSGALATAATKAVTWSTVADLPVATLEGSGIELNDKYYMFGGYDVPRIPLYTPTSRSYVYNPASNAWSALAPLPAFNGTGKPGITHAGIATDGTNIFLAGGYSADAAGNAQIFGAKDVYRYNVAANTYTKLPDLPAERAAGGLSYLNGQLHFVGGIDRTRKVEQTTHWALDLSNTAAGWVTKAPLPAGRNHVGATVLGGKMYIVGGQTGQDSPAISSARLDAYNPATNTWQTLPSMPKALSHTVAATLDGQVVALGGQTSYNVNSADVYAFNPATNAWTALTPLPASRFAGVTGVLNGNLYYVGGSAKTTVYKGVPIPLTTTTPPNTPATTPPATPASTPASTPPVTTPSITTPPPTTPTGDVIRIDAGSTVNTTDTAGRTWLADTGRFTPSTLAAGGSTSTPIAGTPDDSIYATNRSNLGNSTPLANRIFEYAIPTSAATVNVRLLFSESYWTTTNKRRFDVYAEGTKVIGNLDLVAAAGTANTAYDRTLSGVAVTGGVLNLRFQALADFPIISGIEVSCATGCDDTPPVTTPPTTPAKVQYDLSFQPTSVAPPAGFDTDSGEAFSTSRGYGWVTQDSLSSGVHVPIDLTPNTRDRGVVADQRQDSFIHMQAAANSTGLVKTAAAWEATVPNGNYQVTVGVGDPSYIDSTHTIRVEGQTVINAFKPTASTKFAEQQLTVNVSDGRLTVDAIGGTNTKLAYIVVRS